MRLAVLIAAVVAWVSARAQLPLQDGSLVVQAGDSIVNAHGHSLWIATYYHLRHPTLQLYTIDQGRGGDTFTGFLDGSRGTNNQLRIERRVIPWIQKRTNENQNFVSMMLGHNGTFTTNQVIGYAWEFGEEWLTVSNKATPVLVGPHPRVGTLNHKTWEISRLFKAVGDSNSWPAVDTAKALTNYWLASPTVVTGADDVHPDEAWHVKIAQAVLDGLGESTFVSSATIHAGTLAVLSTNDCFVGSVSANAHGGVDFQRTDARLPAPHHWNTWPLFSAAPEAQHWQSYTLAVTGLLSGTYAVHVDGTVISNTYTHTEMASGINMAAWTNGPVYEKGIGVRHLICEAQGVQTNWPHTDIGPPYEGVRYVDSFLDSIWYSETAYDDAEFFKDSVFMVMTNVHAQAQPQTLSFSIRSTTPPAPPDYEPHPGHPDPDDVLGFAIETEVPPWPNQWTSPTTNAPGWYYVTPSGSDAVGNGHPEAPRQSFPGSLSPGDVVFLAGGPWGVLTISGVNGTAESPIFVTASNAAPVVFNNGGSNVLTALTVSTSSYVIIENLKLDGSTIPTPATNSGISPGAAIRINQQAHHVVIRDVEVTGWPDPGYDTTLERGQPFSALISPSNGNTDAAVHSLVFLRLDCHDNGAFPPTYETGRHCISSAGSASNVFVLDSTFARSPEDGIQLLTLYLEPTHWYIGGNLFVDLGEQAMDFKGCSDIIVSANTAFGQNATAFPASGGSGEDITLNDEGPPNRVWIVRNNLYGSRIGIRSQSAGSNYVVANLIHGIRLEGADSHPTSAGQSQGVAVWSAGGLLSIVDNLAYDVAGGIYLSTGSEAHVHGNVVAEIADHTQGYAINLNQAAMLGGATSNLVWDSDGAVRLNRVRTNEANLIDVDPLLVGATNHFRPLRSSPVRAASAESPVYALFEAMYGRSIRQDADGRSRPQQGWDIGPYEVSSRRVNAQRSRLGNVTVKE